MGSAVAVRTSLDGTVRTKKEILKELKGVLPPKRITATWPDAAKMYIIGMSQTGVRKLACEYAGVSYNYPYVMGKHLRGFKNAILRARQIATDGLESKAMDMAMYGPEREVIYRGEVMTLRGQPSENMLMFLLKAADPDRFNEKRDISHHVDGTVRIEDIAEIGRRMDNASVKLIGESTDVVEGEFKELDDGTA